MARTTQLLAATLLLMLYNEHVRSQYINVNEWFKRPSTRRKTTLTNTTGQTNVRRYFSRLDDYNIFNRKQIHGLIGDYIGDTDYHHLSVSEYLRFWNPDSIIAGNRRGNVIPIFGSEKQGLIRSNVTVQTPKQVTRSTKAHVTQKQEKSTKVNPRAKSAKPHLALATAEDGNATTVKIEGKTTTTSQKIPVTKFAHPSTNKNRESNFVISPYQLTSQYKRMLADFPDTNVSSEILGRTASYINLVVFKISKMNSTTTNKFLRAREEQKYAEEVPEKKIIFIVHALSSMGLSALYSLTLEKYLRKLLSYYLGHLDKFDIYLMPLANPDGFIQDKKMPWNKNVSPQGACMGVALDRNFDVAWNSSRQISSCSQHYSGKMPFSEPESIAVRNIFNLYSHKIIAYFHVHAGTYDMNTFKGDAVLYPRGFTEHQSDDDKYIDLRAEIDEAIANANFKVISVTVDTLQSWYGLVAGSSVDYAATVYGIPYAMELVMQVYQDPRELGTYGMYGKNEEMEYYALTEIWKRVINVIFINIYKKNNSVDGRLRRSWK